MFENHQNLNYVEIWTHFLGLNEGEHLWSDDCRPLGPPDISFYSRHKLAQKLHCPINPDFDLMLGKKVIVRLIN